MRRAKIILLTYLFVVSGLVLTALVGLIFSPPDVHDEGTYYEVYWNTIQTFDPAVAYDTVSSLMLDQACEGLYEYDGFDPDFSIIPCLAAAMPEVSADGMLYTIKLRPNVRYPAEWADGSAIQPWNGTPRCVKADDFVFAFQRVADFHSATDHFGSIMQDKIVGANEFRKQTQDKKETEWYYDKFAISGIRAVDDLTLEIELTKPYPQLIYKLMGHPVGPLPREYVHHYAVDVPSAQARERGELGADESIHDRATMKWRMLGTGPFQLEEYQRERHVIFRQNPWYRGRPDVDGHPGGEGGANPELPADQVLPYSIEHLHYVYSKEALPRWYNFTLGEFDKLLTIPKDMFGEAVSSGEVDPVLAAKGVRQHRMVRPVIEYVAFHMRSENEVFKDNLPLRRGMSLAIDRARYVKLFKAGDAMVPSGLVPPGSFTFDADYQAEWYRFDPDEARRQIELAQQIHREKFGKDLPTIRYNLRNTSATTRQAAEFLRLAWEKAGLEVELVFSDFAKWLDDMRARAFAGAYSGGWVADYPDEETFFSLFHSKNYEEGPNGTGYRNPEYDELYDRAKVMLRSQQRDDLYRQMARIIENDLPVTVIYYDIRRMLYYDWLGEIQQHTYLRAQPAYYRLDGSFRQRRLSKEFLGARADLEATRTITPEGDDS